MAYAEAADYTALYDTDMSDERLDAWLEKASTWLDGQMGDRLDADDDRQAAALAVVCIDMVHRCDAGPVAGLGVNSYSQGANGFQESYSFANATGDFYLTKQERKMLGLGTSIGFASVLGGDGDA